MAGAFRSGLVSIRAAKCRLRIASFRSASSRSLSGEADFFDCDKSIEEAIERKYGLDQPLRDFPKSLTCIAGEDDGEVELEGEEEDVFAAISRRYKEKEDTEGNVLAAVKEKYGFLSEADDEQHRAQHVKEKFEFLSVLQRQGRNQDEEELSEEDNPSSSSSSDNDDDVADGGDRKLVQESTALVEFMGKEEIPNLRERKYCYINWEELRRTIVDECVQVMNKRTEFTNLKIALEKWDGMVGNTLVAAVILRMKNSDDAFAFFKWSGQQYNFAHDASTYGALIQYLVEAQKDCSKALLVFKHVERAAVEPDVKMMEVLIDGVSADGDGLKSLEFLEIMWRKVGIVTPRACSFAIEGLFRAGEVDKACELYSEGMNKYDCRRNVMNCNALLKGLCDAGRIDQAVEFFRETRDVNVESYDVLIAALGLKRDLEEAVGYAKRMNEAGFGWTAKTYAALIDLFRNAGRVEEAYGFYQKMLTEKCQGDAKVFNCILRAVNDESTKVNQSQDEPTPSTMVNRAYEVAELMIRNGHVPVAGEFYRLVTGLRGEGDLDRINRLFKAIEKSNKKIDAGECGEFVKLLCDRGEVTLAVKFYWTMTWRRMALDSCTFCRLFTQLCKCGESAQAYVLFAKLEGMGVEYGQEAHESAFGQLCDAGRVGEAYQVYGLMVKRALTTDGDMLQRLLTGFCEIGDSSRGLKVYEAMVRRGFRVSASSCGLLSEALYKAGDVKSAEKVAAEMIDKNLFSSGTN